MHPAIFLDRDGVIIENRRNYVRSWADVEFLPRALAALAKMRSSPYKIVIATNQSAIGRGIISNHLALEINRRVVDEIEKCGGRIDAVFMCPHSPQDECDCRKPKPGLLFQAAEALSLDLSRSVMIGDALSDLMAGQAAGVCRAILLRTGRGEQQARLAKSRSLPPFLIYDTLADALSSLMA